MNEYQKQVDELVEFILRKLQISSYQGTEIRKYDMAVQMLSGLHSANQGANNESQPEDDKQADS